MAVGLGEETPFYLEVEPAVGGVPRALLTVYNVPDGSVIEVRWDCEGEGGPVQGLRTWRVTGVGTAADWAVPLNRPVTYSVFVGGELQSSATVTIPSDTAWIQDPLHPDGAIPVVTEGRVTGHLSMRGQALKSITYANQATQSSVMGSRYPRASSGQRLAGANLDVSMGTRDRSTDDAFRRMVRDAPILLLRTIPVMQPLPPSCYILADVTEQPMTVHIGGDYTFWSITGNLVQAVLQAAQSGFVTYQDVQDLLGGYTYGEVQSAASATTYLDWQKNPLIFTYL